MVDIEPEVGTIIGSDAIMLLQLVHFCLKPTSLSAFFILRLDRRSLKIVSQYEKIINIFCRIFHNYLNLLDNFNAKNELKN